MSQTANIANGKALKSLKWRCIGPFRGGRVVAVAGDPFDPAVFYFGACAGGVWKTYDGGAYWENISDSFFNTAAIGALAVSESDPNVIYAGTGETTIRIDVSHGDGVYKSTDAGKTWTHVGLSDTRHIAKIRIHPTNPDMVYVAALGHAFGPNEERGVFRSTDGGKNWEKVLYKSDKAGAIDLTMDPKNPRILYASIWEAYRTFWTLSSGGPDSGLYKSTDGGDTWVELTNKEGLPKGIKGKIGLAASPARRDRIWALVEAEEGGFFRSDDGGETWQKLTDKADLRYRPWYFSHVIADPQDPDTVYVLNLNMWKSTDGGRTFSEITTPHGDNHDLWIDPYNPQRMIEGNDGGACVSYNGGASWSSIYNQPTAQFYHLDTDNQFFYRVYGTQQDNTSISLASRTGSGAITTGDWYPAGTGESGHIAVHPEDPNIVYVGAIGSSPGGGGALQRYDHRSKQIQLVTVWPDNYTGYGVGELKYRFQWTFPIAFSPHDPNIVYTAGNLLFKTTNEGQSWEAISPDLTRNDPEKLVASGGPITKDTTGAEHYATIFAFAESPHEPGVFWVGSDDGLVHISKDGGQSWTNITPKDLPEWSMISMIEPSPHDPATAYMAVLRHKLDDYRPYLYRTNDYGQSWQLITHGIPENDFTRVIREDPNRRGLLYAGTETGLYISFDDGASWQRVQSNLPVAPIYDLTIKEKDLVVATHGRSFWILDDLSPLYQLSNENLEAEAYLFAPRPTYRILPHIFDGWPNNTEGKNYALAFGTLSTFYETETPEGDRVRRFLDAGEDLPKGVIITYYLQAVPEAEAKLTILDQAGNVIKTFSSQAPAEGKEAKKEKKDGAKEDMPKDPRIPVKAGWNRFVWNMRYPDAEKVPDDKVSAGGTRGPIAVPGTYQVQLTVGDKTQTQSFELLKDPRVSSSQADLEAQFELLIKIRDKLTETHRAVKQLRNVKQQIDEWVSRVEGREDHAAISEAATALKEKLIAVEDVLILPSGQGASDFQMNFKARLNAQLANLPSVVSSADSAPTQQSYEIFEELSGKIDEQLAKLQAILETDVPTFNNLIRRSEIPAIVPKSFEG